MNLTRIRWGCRAVLGVAVVLSVVGNVLHAPDDRISQSMSALPPLVLWATIELIAKVPTARPGWTWGRRLVCLAIGGMAAWISYWHMVAVATRYGETVRGSAYLYPLLVDCLVVVAWICLAELADRIRAAGTEMEVSDGEGTDTRRVRQAAERGGQEVLQAAGLGLQRPDRSEREQGEGPEGDLRSAEEGVEEVAAVGVNLTPTRKPHASSADRVVRAHQRTPDASNVELAKRLKLSEATVKRWRPRAQINGNVPQLEEVDA